MLTTYKEFGDWAKTLEWKLLMVWPNQREMKINRKKDCWGTWNLPAKIFKMKQLLREILTKNQDFEEFRNMRNRNWIQSDLFKAIKLTAMKILLLDFTFCKTPKWRNKSRDTKHIDHIEGKIKWAIKRRCKERENQKHVPRFSYSFLVIY